MYEIVRQLKIKINKKAMSKREEKTNINNLREKRQEVKLIF